MWHYKLHVAKLTSLTISRHAVFSASDIKWKPDSDVPLLNARSLPFVICRINVWKNMLTYTSRMYYRCSQNNHTQTISLAQILLRSLAVRPVCSSYQSLTFDSKSYFVCKWHTKTSQCMEYIYYVLPCDEYMINTRTYACVA